MNSNAQIKIMLLFGFQGIQEYVLATKVQPILFRD